MDWKPRYTLVLVTAVWLGGCSREQPGGTQYFDRVIQPILTNSCAGDISGCHRANPTDPYKFAAGNLDVTSFDNIKKRPDVLRTYGSYPAPFLLLKGVSETNQLQIVYNDQNYPSRIPHAGGSALQVGSPAFVTLQLWLENGATRDGQRPIPAPVEGSGDCSTAVPADFDPMVVTTTPEFGAQGGGAFDDVMGVIGAKGCNAQNCHGAPQADFYITCGTDATQRAFNFRQIWSFVDTPVDDSEFLQRTVAGGIPHTGGAHFQTRSDADYQRLATWATAVGKLQFGETGGQQFFRDNIQPILLARGCASEGCHSPAAMNDFKLRAGTLGFFSAVALEKNYDLARREFLAFEMPDVRRGRIVAKNIFPEHGGIRHRGGSLLESGTGADPATCTGPFTPGTSSDFCTFVEWARIERMESGDPNAGVTVPYVYVERQANHVARAADPTLFQPGSNLRVKNLDVSAAGVFSWAGGDGASLIEPCGANPASVDVRGPDVRNDGQTVVFAMRASAGESFRLYTTVLGSGVCNALPMPPAGAHDVDPAWSPDGLSIVFASTRAGGNSKRIGVAQTDLWRMDANGSNLERITFLSNSEFSPAFMREGRITMSTEKADPADPTGGFYQIAGRRLNWDLTDYHPLLAQRATSPILPGDATNVAPSVGYPQATEIREGTDGNFLLILSPTDATGGAGTVGIFNRSVGPFEAMRSDPGFLQALIVPRPNGLFRSPVTAFDGRILVSYAGDGAPNAASYDFDPALLDPRTGQVVALYDAPGSVTEGVLALEYDARKMFLNRRQLVFGGQKDSGDTSHAIVHFPDAPMLVTLLGSNLRRGRDVEAFRSADRVVLFDDAMNRLGEAPLAADGSVRIRAPAGRPVVIALFAGGNQVFQMTEEHQWGPGENISLGVAEPLYDNVCGGCHGSRSGVELDIAVDPDVLTGASQSLSATASPTPIGP